MKNKIRNKSVILFVGASLPFIAKLVPLFFGIAGYMTNSIYKVFQLLAPCYWRYKEGKKGFDICWPIHSQFPTKHIWCISTAIALILSTVAILLAQFLIPIFGLDPETIREGYDSRFTVGPVGAIAIVIFLSFVNSALEEFHFRMWLDKEISRIYGDYIGISISAVAFGIMHGLIFLGLPNFPFSIIILTVIGLAIAGSFWSLLIRKRGGIYAAWWSHGLTDAIILTWGLMWLGYV